MAGITGINLTLSLREPAMAGQRNGYIRASSLHRNTRRRLQ
ncbi:hypothetical protein [Pseudarthrobacter albicanus]|nr:hypothetical protein [Pseudarthrobacter albicanus]